MARMLLAGWGAWAMLVSVGSATVIYSHEGDAKPTTEGFSVMSSNAPYTEAGGTETIGQNEYDYWGMNVDGIRLYGGALSSGQYDSPDGWTASARLRVVSFNADNKVLGMSVGDGQDSWWITLSDDAVYYRLSGGVTVKICDMNTTNDYHMYRMVFDPKNTGTSDDEMRFYIDDVLAITLDRSDVDDATNTNFSFGKSSNNGVAEARWNFVQFETGQVPEPATLGVLILGGVGMMLRRRKK